MPLDYPLHERTLDNGLRVVVSPDHSVPTATVNLWVGVGSRHEVEGRTGFAHLFEHLMFQGSRNVASGEHFSLLMAHGGRLNATTWFDRTNYFETVPVGATELALWLEADRHAHLLDAVTQANLDNQRDVVKEEKRQRYDNQPYGTALTTVYAAVFPEGHPYHHPTIGSMEDLDAATLEDVHTFFKAHYAPDNTVLTLCGDLTPEAGFALAERHFGPLTAGAEPRRPDLPELAPLTEPVHVTVDDAVPNERLYVAFRLPVAGTDELLAAAMALDIVGGLGSSRLMRRLVRGDQSVTGIQTSAWGFVDGVSLGMMMLDVAPDSDAAAVEPALVDELERLGRHGPTDDELAAALAQAERAWLHTLAGQEERADLVSQYALLHGDPQLVNTRIDQIRAVTAAHVQQAAAHRLRPEQRAAVRFRPATVKGES